MKFAKTIEEEIRRTNMVTYQFIYLYSQYSLWELLDKIKEIDTKAYDKIANGRPLEKAFVDLVKFWFKQQQDNPKIIIHNSLIFDDLEDIYQDLTLNNDPAYKSFQFCIVVDPFTNKVLQSEGSLKTHTYGK